MSRTYALVGTRPDLAGSLAKAQLSSLPHVTGAASSWGIGFFEKDEVLLKKGRGTPEDLPAQVHPVRSHALLIHERGGKQDAASLESFPPLRFGHLLFACGQPQHGYEEFGALVRERLPDYLRRTVRGHGFAELAFALLLARLPSSSVARSRMNGPQQNLTPLTVDVLGRALRDTVGDLDELSHRAGTTPFLGDLWLHTGEALLVAHRQGYFGINVLRGRADLVRWEVPFDPLPQGLEQSLFVTVAVTPSSLGQGWEPIPHQSLFVAIRGEVPRTEPL